MAVMAASKPLLKTPPGRRSKCSSSMAWSMREPILVTLETSSYESSFFSRAFRNLSPHLRTWVYGGLGEHHRTSGEGLPLPRGLEVGNRAEDPTLRKPRRVGEPFPGHKIKISTLSRKTRQGWGTRELRAIPGMRRCWRGLWSE